MKAGSLRRQRVTIEELVIEIDSDGAQVPGWFPVFDRPIPAKVTDLSGRELIAAAAVSSKVSTRIVVRYRAELKAGQRATHRGTIYGIEAVIPDPDSGIRYVTLQCSAGVNEG